MRRAQHSASFSAGPMQPTQQTKTLLRPGLRPPIRVVAGHITGLPRSTTTPTRETLFPPMTQHLSAQVRVETPLVCEQGITGHAMPKVVGYLGNTCCSQFDSNTIPAALLPAIPFQQRFFQQRFLQWLTRFLPLLLPVHLISGV